MRRPLASAVLFASLLLGAPGFAFAQTLDPAVLAADPVSKDQTSQIDNYVAKYVGDLAGTGRKIKEARTALLKPLEAHAISVDGRTNYAAALMPTLDRLVSDKRDEVAFNALRICGDLATTNALNLVQKALNDPRPSVQYGAVEALGRTFDLAQRTGNGVLIPGETIQSTIDKLSAFAAKQSDPRIIDGVAVALSKAARHNDRAVVNKAIVALARLGSDQAKAINGSAGDAERAAAVLRSAGEIRNVAQGGLQGNAQLALTPDTLKSAAGFAGDIMAAIARTVKAEKRDSVPAAPLFRAAEGLLSTAHNAMTPAQPPLPANTLEAQLGSNPSAFLTGLNVYVGPQGVLTKAPYAFPADRFKY